MRPLGAVHVIRPDGTDETVVSGETVVWSGNFGPAWSADSRRLAYVTPETLVHPEFGEYTVPKGIEIATRASSGWTRSPVAGVEGIGDQVMLLWAPVGERLAFVRELGADPEGFLQSALTVVEPDGTLRTVTEEPVSQGFCWSYDATRIAAIIVEGRLLAFDVATGVEVADFGTTVLNVGDACVWSGWAGQSN